MKTEILSEYDIKKLDKILTKIVSEFELPSLYNDVEKEQFFENKTLDNIFNELCDVLSDIKEKGYIYI